ncbi:UNVERIFIED_CONTAM: hypothetical protein GTU68_023702 [Idotea baltica]|nr:hypothetical protein [Idotea baltica]
MTWDGVTWPATDIRSSRRRTSINSRKKGCGSPRHIRRAEFVRLAGLRFSRAGLLIGMAFGDGFPADTKHTCARAKSPCPSCSSRSATKRYTRGNGISTGISTAPSSPSRMTTVMIGGSRRRTTLHLRTRIR